MRKHGGELSSQSPRSNDRWIRDPVIVLVGGAPLNEAFAEEVEADAYCRDAAVAVETAKKLLAIKRGEVTLS